MSCHEKVTLLIYGHCCSSLYSPDYSSLGLLSQILQDLCTSFKHKLPRIGELYMLERKNESSAQFVVQPQQHRNNMCQFQFDLLHSFSIQSLLPRQAIHVVGLQLLHPQHMPLRFVLGGFIAGHVYHRHTAPLIMILHDFSTCG